MITDEGWQLILPTELGRCAEGLPLQLFDLRSDPRARRNVAEEHPERVEELTRFVRFRLREGIPGALSDFDDAGNLERLRGLGYVEAGIVDQLRSGFEELSLDELLARVSPRARLPHPPGGRAGARDPRPRPGPAQGAVGRLQSATRPRPSGRPSTGPCARRTAASRAVPGLERASLGWRRIERGTGWSRRSESG